MSLIQVLGYVACTNCPRNDLLCVDVDQWLGRRSLDGGLSLIYS